MEKREITNRLKSLFTCWWEYLAIRAACRLNLFDLVAENKHTPETLATHAGAEILAISILTQALCQAGYLSQDSGYLNLTEAGAMLTESHPDCLKNACMLWGSEHMTAWQHLDQTIKTGKPAFEFMEGKSYFDYLATHTQARTNYHHAMHEYARDDYRNIATIADFRHHRIVADVGGGTGGLIQTIATANPHIRCILFDLPEVTELIDYQHTFDIISGNFFHPLPFRADAIVLSRVLHDWPDEAAAKILAQAHNALSPEGTLYVIENMNDEINAHLLALNMLLMCGSVERSHAQYVRLLADAGFEPNKILRLNDLQTILIAKRQ